MQAKWSQESLGLGSLITRARAVEAVQSAMKRGEFSEFLGIISLKRPEMAASSSPRAEGKRTRMPRAVSPEQLITVEEVAELLQLKLSTIRAYAERGSLPCVRVGNRLRFRPSDVDLWIEQRHSKGGS